jgi:hypothetical protein
MAVRGRGETLGKKGTEERSYPASFRQPSQSQAGQEVLKVGRDFERGLLAKTRVEKVKLLLKDLCRALLGTLEFAHMGGWV